jgi:hypothetical protein
MIKTIFSACMLCAVLTIQAQDAIPVSGGEAAGSGGTVSYSVGQLMYTTNIGSGTVSQGIQQAFEFQTLSNPELTTVNLTVVTYPNPTKDFIILKITDSALNNLRYTLFDVNGKAISSGSITESNTQVQLKHLSIGAYILKVSQQNQSLKTFKILKQQ